MTARCTECGSDLPYAHEDQPCSSLTCMVRWSVKDQRRIIVDVGRDEAMRLITCLDYVKRRQHISQSAARRLTAEEIDAGHMPEIGE